MMNSKVLILIFGLIFCLDVHAQQHTKLIEHVLFQLNLKIEDCMQDMIVEKQVPGSLKESIVVIPKIVEMEEDYFSLDTYIVVVNNVNGNIKHKYYESNQTNGWESDAIMLSKISIDTAPYLVKDKTRAFGIRVSFRNMSKPNPYSHETLSLFVPKGDKLIQVLKNLQVDFYSGEWDTHCSGAFDENESILVMLPTKTNDYFDIKVKTKVSHIESAPQANGECKDNISVKNEEKILKFQNGKYK